MPTPVGFINLCWRINDEDSILVLCCGRVNDVRKSNVGIRRTRADLQVGFT